LNVKGLVPLKSWTPGPEEQ